MASPLLEAVRRAAEADPNAPAFIAKNALITRGHLQGLVREAARVLHERGIRPGDTVGLALGRNVLHCVVQLALGRLGALSVPLAGRLSAAERAALIARFDIRSVVAAGDLPGVAVPLVKIDKLRGSALTPEPGLGGFEPGADTPFRVALTSGSTGERKAILHTHAGFMHRIATTLHLCDEKSRVLPPDLHITLAMVFAIGVLTLGGTVVFDETFHFAEVAAVIREHGVTHLMLPPASVAAMAAVLPRESPAFPSLRHLRLLGAAPTPAMLELLRTRFSPNVYAVYGLTEVGMVALATPEMLAADPATAGKPTPWARIEIVDGAGRALPAGERGEIRIAVDGMPAGYYRQADAGRLGSQFRDGWFYPGDVGRLSPQGWLYVDGRADDVVNVGGYKFSLAAVDRTLAEHAGVRQAASFTYDAPGGTPALGLAVALRHADDLADVMRHCDSRMDRSVPWRLYVVDEIPTGELGKVDREKVKEKALGPRH